MSEAITVNPGVDFNRFEIKTDTRQIDFWHPHYPGWYEHRISFWIVGNQYTTSFVSEKPDPNHTDNLSKFSRCFQTMSNMLSKAGK